MTESVAQRTGAMSSRDAKELRKLLDAMRSDLSVLHAAITAMATKLNADATVTDTNYAAPAALTTTA